MALSSTLQQVIKQEIQNDPEKLGYHKFLSHPSQIAAIINNPRNLGIVENESVLDIWTYINWLENLQTVNNVHLVKNLVIQIFQLGHGGTLSGTYENSGGAAGTLAALDAYGLDVVLNSFGVSNYTGNKPKLLQALKDTLGHAVSVGIKKESAIVLENKINARISILFENVAGAPNAISEQDVADIIKTL